MTKGQRFKTLVETKIQGKTFKLGTTFEVYMTATNHEKENHIVVVCNKNGKAKSVMNAKNHVGINQKQIDLAIKNNVIEVLV